MEHLDEGFVRVIVDGLTGAPELEVRLIAVELVDHLLQQAQAASAILTGRLRDFGSDPDPSVSSQARSATTWRMDMVETGGVWLKGRTGLTRPLG